MNETKANKFLEDIMAEARLIGKKPNPPVTAERVLIVLIDRILKTPQSHKGYSLLRCETLLNALVEDLNTAREQLMEYVCADQNMSFLDDLYMKKRMQAAGALARAAEVSWVSAEHLLKAITEEPSAPIAKILNGKKQSPAQTYSVEKLIDDVLMGMDDDDKKDPDVSAGKDSEYSGKREMAGLVAEVETIRKALSGSVFGQDNAINVFVNGYFQASLLSMIDRKRTRPKATFLFAGPPGVGKTFMAEKAAEALKLPFMRFDMSEYADKEANLEFCGSDKVYKNGKSGNVTSFVAKNPKCILLFDEIEKAHLSVIHLFLQMLDAGRLRDNYTDEEVSFSNAIIILTTNAGKKLYEDSDTGDFSAVSRKVIIGALQKDINPATNTPYFPGAICSRFASGNVVMFNHIGASFLRTIAKKEIQRHSESLCKEIGIEVKVDEKVFTALLFAEGASADARTVRGRAESFFNDELYELLRLIASNKVKTGIEDIETIQIGVDLSHVKQEILSLFQVDATPKLLVFADDAMAELCRQKLPEFEVLAAQDFEQAVELLRSQEIGFALLDMHCGADENALESLNIEDAESPARDFYRFLREQHPELPLYLLEGQDVHLSEEERVSFMRQGVRGVLQAVKGKDAFAEEVSRIFSALHQQAAMTRLARANKLVSFETAQTISKDGKQAQIRLFDLKMSTAVDSEDSKNLLSSISKPNVRFADVIGAQDAKRELAYFVEYLKDPKKYMGTGVKAPKGVLLYGPPGTGKTMLAKAMAKESDVTFIAAEGNQFLKKYVGEGSEKVHELFKTARKYAPAILFVDEIDAIGRERGNSGNLSGGSDQTLTAFLTEMDGFVTDPSKPVFVLAATNFDVTPGGEKSLDPALLRRFDRRVFIELPGKEDRICFLKNKMGKNPAFCISDQQVENLAIRSTGMSLAELDSAMELALRSAIRSGSTTVTDAILEEAFETFNNGDTKHWDASQLERVARHEAGHAFLCWHSGETPSYLTVVARGSHGGYMQHGDQEGKALYTRQELLSRIRTSLGGRAAELLYYGPQEGISTGAAGDLANATRVARRIVCNYGMESDFGLAVLTGKEAETAEVRAAVNAILKEQMELALGILRENRHKVDALVEMLLKENHLNGPKIEAVLKNN